jgi:hypothetical protein
MHSGGLELLGRHHSWAGISTGILPLNHLDESKSLWIIQAMDEILVKLLGRSTLISVRLMWHCYFRSCFNSTEISGFGWGAIINGFPFILPLIGGLTITQIDKSNSIKKVADGVKLILKETIIP